MKNFKLTIYGFICFFFTSLFCVLLTILVYRRVINENNLLKYGSILLLITFISIFYTISDVIRRKIMIDRPLNEILKAIDNMARGEFNVNLIVNSYRKTNEFDAIKSALNNISHKLATNEMVNNDFIANFSHEIKTPISIIQNYVKILQNKDLSEEKKNEYLDKLRLNCQRLNSLVINILKLNKLDNQKIIINYFKFNVSEKLVDTIVQYEGNIENKKIELNCDIEDNLFLESEESYIEIIFNNLISNAIKFSNQNGLITISLKKAEDSIKFVVADNGCGMDKETGEHIFDKFYQGDTSHSSEGNGLGLTLVKKVIDVLGGVIYVESELNKGTTFTVFIKEKK